MFDKYINQLIVNKVFDFEEDKIMMMKKVPFVLFPARSMAKFIQTISVDLGTKEALRLGYSAGEISSKQFADKLGWLNNYVPDRMTMIFKMFEVMGFGRGELKIWNQKENKLLALCTNQPVINWGKKLYGDKELICPFYMAIVSAHMHHEIELKDCWLIETQCISKGAKFCEWSYNVFKQQQEEANKNRPVLDDIDKKVDSANEQHVAETK